MSCCVDVWEMKCLKRGDTTKEKLIGIAYDITDCTFLMQFKKAKVGLNDNIFEFDWSSLKNNIVRSEADDYTENGVDYMVIKILPQKIDVEPGLYVSDLEMTLADGTTVNTLFDVNLKIVEDYSGTV